MLMRLYPSADHFLRVPQYGGSVEDYMKAKGKDEWNFASDAEPDLFFLWHLRPTDRMAAQQTYFSMSSQILSDHETVLSEAIPEPESPQKFVKLLIPPDKKIQFMRHLRRLNITARALFPGVDGLGRSIRELATLGTLWKQG